jgi:hypothetical protein
MPHAAPSIITELANSCVAYVERALGTRLDFTPETLPLLDHYVKSAAAEARQRPEASGLVARVIGAYLGEVMRRSYECWWHPVGDDVAGWQLRFAPVFLALSPFDMAAAALGIGVQDEALDAGFIIEEDEINDLGEHLARLPPVPEDEFFLPTTRFDVLEILVEQLKGRAVNQGLGEVAFDDDDYND